MKIVVISPSLNEEDNIQKIVRVIDGGLYKYYPKSNSLIVNVDSNSDDDTVKFFLNCPTRFSKKSIINRDSIRGKGANIKKALSRFKNKFDYFMMIDSDVTSAQESWVFKLLSPLVKGKSQIVIPLYTRNRYESNTTNHFSSPIIYACLNKDISQPIAGEFGFTNKLAVDIYKEILYPSDYKYGIDTVITWTAILKDYRIEQSIIGKKIHKPSFPKIVPMFEQVASTTFRLVNQNRIMILENLKKKDGEMVYFKCIDEKYVLPVNVEKRKKIKKIAIEMIKMNPPPIFLDRKHYGLQPLTSFMWVDILADYLKILLTNKLTIKETDNLAKSIVGYYLLRVLGYLDEVEKMSTQKIERILIGQKIALRKNLVKKLIKLGRSTYINQ